MFKTLAILGLVAASLPLAQADSLAFNGASGNLKAMATFDFSGNVLTITLKNTATVMPTGTAGALTGLFFNLTGNPILTPVSALLPAGSSIIQTTTCSSSCAGITNVGGEFSYASGGLASLPGTDRGIASSGYLNANASAGNFNGVDLDSPAALNGANFGIVPSGFVDFSGNGGMDNDPLIKDTVVFTLNGVSGLSAANVSNVFFTYGTAQPGDASFRGTAAVPEPTSVVLLGTIAGLVSWRLRKRSAQA